MTENKYFFIPESQRELRRLQSRHAFKSFVIKFNKTYENVDEYLKRFKIYKDNMKKVQFLKESEQGSGRYGPTIFSDLTAQEFKEQHLGFYPPKYNPVSNSYDSDLPLAEIPNEDLPASFDWRDHGAVTPVKNQGLHIFHTQYYFIYMIYH